MEQYIQFLKDLGMKDGKQICADTIRTAAWTRYRCQYGCGCYGKNLCCPPYAPDYKSTREMIGEYHCGILFTSDKNNTSLPAVALARKLFLDGYYKAIAFGSGPCELCESCTLTHCRFPKKAIPSMEGCGIDVFATARANGYQIDPLKTESCEAHYFGLVLVE